MEDKIKIYKPILKLDDKVYTPNEKMKRYIRNEEAKWLEEQTLNKYYDNNCPYPYPFTYYNGKTSSVYRKRILEMLKKEEENE